MKNWFFIPLVIFVNTSFSQIKWADDSPKWFYEGLGYVDSYNEITYLRDTIISNDTAKILGVSHVVGGDNTDTRTYDIITLAKDSVVYKYESDIETFDTLYAFSTKPNDEWQMHCYTSAGGLCDKDATVKVIESSSVVVNQQTLKQLVVDYHFGVYDNVDVIARDTIIESIGSTQLYINPWDYLNLNLDAHEGGKLRCYMDDELGSFKNNYSRNCDYLSVTKLNSNEPITISPNPCSEYFKFSESFNIASKVYIYNLTGEQVYHQELNPSESVINIEGLTEGIYFVHSIIDNQTVQILKLIKE